MPKYRKKPVVVEAVQWTGKNWQDFLDFAGHVLPFADEESGCMIVSTIRGEMVARPADYIVRNEYGEVYPCKPDIFEKTYERVEEDA